MSNLTYQHHKTDNGIEVIIQHPTGEAFFTQTGYAIMAGITQQAVNKRCKGCNHDELLLAEILTPKGLQGCNLIPAGLAFKWAMKDNPDLAMRMGECGATVFAYQLAGIEVKAQTKPLSNLDLMQRNLEVMQLALDELKRQDAEIEEIKRREKERDDRIETIEMEVTANSMELERFSNGHGYWYTIAGFAKLKGIKPDVTWCNLQGRKASAMCKQRNIKPTKVNDPRFGEVNCYPDSVLHEMIWN